MVNRCGTMIGSKERDMDDDAVWLCSSCGEEVDYDEILWATPDGVLTTERGEPYCEYCVPGHEQPVASAEDLRGRAYVYTYTAEVLRGEARSLRRQAHDLLKMAERSESLCGDAEREAGRLLDIVREREGDTRTCDGCGKVEDAGTFPDQDGQGRSECCWDKEEA